MIAATEPQEYIPIGRQQIASHPNLIDLPNLCDGEHSEIPDCLLQQRFQKVSISDTNVNNSEWWSMRDASMKQFGGDPATCSGTYDINRDGPSRSHKNHDRAQRKCYHARGETCRLEKTAKDYLKCKSNNWIEEELYVKNNVAIWSRGTTSSSRNEALYNCCRTTICSYSSEYLIKHALWCTFYYEKPEFESSAVKNSIGCKPDEPLGKPMPALCLIGSQNIKVFTSHSEDFTTTLPFTVGNVWRTKFGILLAKEKVFPQCRKLSPPDDSSPTIFSLSHPLNEVSPTAIYEGGSPLRLLDDLSLSIVFTSDEPSICMLYDSRTNQHSVYYIRRVRNAESVEMSFKTCTTAAAPSSPFDSSNRLKKRLSFWDSDKDQSVPSIVGSRGGSATYHPHNQSSRLQSPMATISRCQSPKSSLAAEKSWSSRFLARNHTSLRNTSIDTSVPVEMSVLDTTVDHQRLTPALCFEHLWTDSFSSQLDNLSSGPASKVFLADDLVGRSYLCYLIPIRSQLFIVQCDICSVQKWNFGLLTSISAIDAAFVPHLHMIAILEHSRNVVLYSGMTLVGKLHIGGVLTQHSPSPFLLRNTLRFHSPFPRRSTLIPNCTTPSPDPRFDEHLLSPVLPVDAETFGVHFVNSNHSRVQLSALRDAVNDRITLQYSDESYYRVVLPSIASYTLIENCINCIRGVVPKDCATTFLCRWYAVRNAPGPEQINLEQEWHMFTVSVLESLGYEYERTVDLQMQPDNSATPSSSAKKQRPTSIATNSDWHNLIESDQFERRMSWTLQKVLNLRTCVERSVGSSREECCKQPIMVIDSGNKNDGVLFSHIKIIHFALHLFYEELKLYKSRMRELVLLSKFLCRLATDLHLADYQVYYWKDFPEQVAASIIIEENRNSSSQNDDDDDFKNEVVKDVPDVAEKPPSIMQFVYDLLDGTKVVQPFPYVRNVNPTTKSIVQLCSTYVRGTRCPYSRIQTDDCIRNVVLCDKQNVACPTTSLKERGKVQVNGNVHEVVVLLMTEMGFKPDALEMLPDGIFLLLEDAIRRCRENPPSIWPRDAYILLQRSDLAKSQLQAVNKTAAEVTSSLEDALPTIKKVDDGEQEDGMEHVESALFKLRFPEDHRVSEARRLLQSSKPVPITLVQRPDVSDHDFIEEQEKHLYAICARTMALPVGRGMFTLRTVTPVTTEPLPVPKLCLTGKAPPRGVTIELGRIDYPQNMHHWAVFHNGVANGLRISPEARDIDSTWIVYNKSKSTTETSIEHAGFLMALGLNGHLKNLTVFNTFDYLTKFNEMMSMGILLGLSAAMRETCDTSITKMLSIHVEALLPPTSMELDIPQNLQVAALLGVGLVYQGSADRRMTEVLLTEIGRPPGPEMENSVDRESYSLSAGLALGLVSLMHGGLPSSSSLRDLNVADTLHYYMVGGNRKLLTGTQKDKYKVPSFQIREGSSVNLDVTAPGATLALGLMYLRSGNKTIADWMSPPRTQYLLDFVRPDFLMLRILAKGLILWNEIMPEKEWVESQVPETVRPYCMVKPSLHQANVDYEAMNQAYCNIVAGACFALGLRFAGSANEDAFDTLLYYCRMFTSLMGKSIAELAGKPTIETCLNVVLLSASMVMAGTGNLDIMRLVRHLRRRVGSSSNAVVTYGSHLAVHMALGLLFLGGGRYTLSGHPSSVAALVCAFYPKFPTHSGDNRYHLQAFRHLYVLAVEPRLIIFKDVGTKNICYVNLRVVSLDGACSSLRGPCLIPDLRTLSKVMIVDERYWPIVFEKGTGNWDHLSKVLQTCGFIEVKQRAGCLSYEEDKFGHKSRLARTLTHSVSVPWNPILSTIASFCSDSTIRNFTDHFLNFRNDDGSDTDICEKIIRHTLLRSTYECIIKDKLVVLPVFSTLLWAAVNLVKSRNTLQMWQTKLICAQVSSGLFSVELIHPEMVVAFKQTILSLVDDGWESEIGNQVASYLKGNVVVLRNSKHVLKLANYITLFDIPFGAAAAVGQENRFATGEEENVVVFDDGLPNGLSEITVSVESAVKIRDILLRDGT